MSSQEQQQGVEMEEHSCPSIWEPVAHVQPPEDAWEYQVRKSLNDAAFQTLTYKPYVSTMPVRRDVAEEDAKFIWTKK